MGDLTKNVSRHELACKCGCGFATLDWKTLNILQDTANHFALLRGVPKVSVAILSAARCVAHNKAVGGAETSKHLQGLAVDFAIEGVHPHVVYDYLDRKYPTTLGLGKYSTFTHLDARSERARW